MGRRKPPAGHVGEATLHYSAPGVVDQVTYLAHQIGPDGSKTDLGEIGPEDKVILRGGKLQVCRPKVWAKKLPGIMAKWRYRRRWWGIMSVETPDWASENNAKPIRE